MEEPVIVTLAADLSAGQAQGTVPMPATSWGRNGSDAASFYYYDRARRREEPIAPRTDESRTKRRRSRSYARDSKNEEGGPRRTRRYRHGDGDEIARPPRAPEDRRGTERRRRRRVDEETGATGTVAPKGEATNGNDGKDDSIGHYEGQPGDVMAGIYEITGEAGVGTFGRVLECFDRRHRQHVAIKVVRNIARYTESAAVEAEILRDVNAAALTATESPRASASASSNTTARLPADRQSTSACNNTSERDARRDNDGRNSDENNESTSRGSRARAASSRSCRKVGGDGGCLALTAQNVLGTYSLCAPSALCVRLLSTFDFQGHFCLVFEKLGMSLYELLKTNNYRPFFNTTVARMSRQLLEALDFLHDLRLIHTDLKLENVLLRDPELLTVKDPRSRDAEPLKIPKFDNIVVIDFGGATYNDERKSSIINTRQYRAPEVILNVGWSMPSDLWSAGCIVAELRKGDLLFATHSNTEHIGLIEKSVGYFPRHMLERSRYFEKYFDTHSGRSKWASALGREGREHVRNMPSLETYCGQDNDLRQLLRGLLVIDPEKRLSAKEALNRCQMLDPARLN